MIDNREIDSYLTDDPSGRFMVGDLATRFNWTGGVVGRDGTGTVAKYSQPSGLTVELVWHGDTLVRALRGTWASRMKAEGDAFTGPEMLKVAAMWLEDNE